MLQLHHADELDPLLDALAKVLEPAPADPFTADVVVVPTAGLADAAKVGLGRRLGARGTGHGVVANIEFLYPGQFLARALGAVAPGADPQVDPWQISRLTWFVLDELVHGSIDVPGADGANRWALARRIADLFDRYATQRPRLIQQWADGHLTDGTYTADGLPAALSPDHHWQAHLWQAVRARIGTPSPPERLPGLLDGLRSGEVQPLLPQRVSLFGLGSMAPSQFTVLRALAEVRDVHVFLRHPSRVAWANSPHRLAGGLTARSLLDVTSHTTHPLLESWGLPALEARALVHGAPDVAEFSCSVALPAPTTLLAEVQRCIRVDEAPTTGSVTALDGSFQVHACHGEVRQLEAVRDALGHAFVADPTLQAHEVVVLCPDLDRFAPLVEAVFQRGTLPIPVRIGDRSLSSADPVGSTVHSVLAVVAGRATLSEVLALVQHEPLRQRFGWSVDQVEQIADWCSRLGTRWGLSAEHRTEWGLPGSIHTGTWRAMADRLLAGAALPAPDPRVGPGGVPPFDDMGTDDVALAGSMADLLGRLVDLHESVQTPRPVGEWVQHMHRAVDDFCGVSPDDMWRRQRVHRELEQLADSAQRSSDPDDVCSVPLSLPELRAALEESIGEQPGRLSLRSGSVTVSSFLPQHGVPARVVCVVGLDDGAVRGGTFDGDDVLGVHPCVGERHPRHEARQLLLDAVLSAGERLIISCNGADLTTNKELPLVVPLVELLEQVGRSAALDGHYGPVVVRHPRHGFNERALVPGGLVHGAAVPFTFDHAMLEAASARRAAAAARPGDVESPWALPAVSLDVVEVQQLLDTVANPSKVYLRDRLEVFLPSQTEAVDDGLAVSVDPLATSSLGRGLLEARRRGHPFEQWYAAARLDGTLPPGELNAAALDEVREEVESLEQLAAQMGVPLAGTEQVDITSWVSLGELGESAQVKVVGTIDGVARSGSKGTVVKVRFARSRPSHRLGAAVQVALLERQYPDIRWSGVVVDRGVSTPTAFQLQLRGDGGERMEAADRLLAMVMQLREWALRDAVPLFDRASARLAFDDFGGADEKLDDDLNDSYVEALWPDVSLDSLRFDPVAKHDPSLLLPGEDHPARSGRGHLVARWVWHTYYGAIVETDAKGKVIDPLASEGGEEE